MSDPRPKVLYISYDGMTDVLGQSQVIPYLKALSDAYHIHILSFEKPDRLQKRGEDIKRDLEKYNISWRHAPFSSGLPVLPKLLDRRKLIRMAKAWHDEVGFDLVHCRSYVAAEAGWRLKGETGVKFLFDMRGFWVDERVEGGLWDQRNPIYRLAYRRYKKLEQKMLEDCDALVCLTRPAFQTLMRWGVDARKISVIPCAADTSHFCVQQPEVRAARRKKFMIPDDSKVLLYLGSMGTWYMLDEMLDFYRQFRENTKARFLFLSPDDPEQIFAAARRKGLDVAEIVVYESERNEVPMDISVADAGIFFIRASFSKTASSPTKLGEMLSCGIPVIANAGVGDVDEVLSIPGAGIILKDFSEKAYHRAVKEFQAGTWSAETIHEVAMRYFDLKNGVSKYRELYKQCLE